MSKKECGFNYGKILFDTWIKHAGSIEKFLYRKINPNNSPNRFFKVKFNQFTDYIKILIILLIRNLKKMTQKE